MLIFEILKNETFAERNLLRKIMTVLNSCLPLKGAIFAPDKLNWYAFPTHDLVQTSGGLEAIILWAHVILPTKHKIIPSLSSASGGAIVVFLVMGGKGGVALIVSIASALSDLFGASARAPIDFDVTKAPENKCYIFHTHRTSQYVTYSMFTQ